MPHLRKENRQLDVHSLFIFYYSFRSSISLLFDRVLALFSSRTIILVHCIIPIRPFCPSPPPPTATSLSHLDLTLDSLSLFSLVYFALCSLFSLSLSLCRLPATLLSVACLLSSASPTRYRPDRDSALYGVHTSHTSGTSAYLLHTTDTERDTAYETTPMTRTIAVVNATGRQAASLIRVASAVGYHVRAQIHSLKGIIAQELQGLPNVSLFQGPLLDNVPLMDTLFEGAHLAFINTTSQAGDEVAIGRALADAAKRAGTVQHYIYSSMPDHSVHGPWPPVPLWAPKFTVENYIRQLELPATFVYAGIYNNNFTSLPYPLFQMELMSDGSFEWHAPFHPDIQLPWLDVEHDVGPTLLQIFKDGPKRWHGHR